MSPQDAERGQSHEPVLLKEVTEWLRPESGGTFVDCTLGLGGHTEALLSASSDVKVIGLDRDPEALALAQERLRAFTDRFKGVHANFRDVDKVLENLNVAGVRGMLADLGVSSLQFDRGNRGFSFTSDAPLDMRMDQSDGQTAADLINELTESEIADLIFEYGEERGARKIARAIVREREREPITTTKQLSDLVVRTMKVPGRWRIHPATRTFQALRIAVNEELASLESFIPAAISALAQGGRLAIISFHSLEDRIVKRSFLRESGRCICHAEAGGKRKPAKRREWFGGENLEIDETALMNANTVGDVVCNRCGARKRVEVLTRKPIRPGQEEVDRNPRSRSALLRVCEKV